MATRRAFLRGFAALTLSLPAAGWADVGAPAWLGCARGPDGGFVLAGIRADGALAFELPLPARGHAGARHPVRAQAVVMARRPGLYAQVIDCLTGAVAARLAAPEGHHFNGHAAFLEGGAVLATVEQRAHDSAGLIGLWETEGWRRIGVWETGGLGPHEGLALPEGGMVVANGGIATDPTDREKLNVPDMRPSLVWLDAGGRLAERLELPGLRQNSIRHLARARDGRVAFAMQWEGDPARVVPLLGLCRRGEAPVLALAPDPEAGLMQGYAGSVAWSGDGGRVAITSPRGGRVQVFDAAGGFLGAVARADVCGLAPAASGLLTSDGTGALLLHEAEGPRLLARHALAWDNHLVPV